jgi:hypothetical protein
MFSRSVGKILTRPSGILVGLLGILLVIATALSGWGAAPYEPRTILATVKPGEILVTNGVDETGRIDYRIQKLLNSTPPAVGLFGSHAIQRLSAEEIGLSAADVTNYFVMHIGLGEIGDLLRRLEAGDVLPRNRILVHLPHPHSVTWDHMNARLRELPVTIELLYSDQQITDRVRNFTKQMGGRLRERLDLRIILARILKGPIFGLACENVKGVLTIPEALLKHAARQADRNNWLDTAKLESLGLITLPGRQFGHPCGPLLGMRGDGSVWKPDFRFLGAPINKFPKANRIATGSEGAIVRMMGRINEIGQRNNRRVHFFAPPMFEEASQTSPGKMLDRVINMARERGMSVLDHRQLRKDRSLFISHLRPTSVYLKMLLEETRE